MYKKISYSTILILLTWACTPFYFAGITSIHKLIFYAFSIIPVCMSFYRGIKNNVDLSCFYGLFFVYFIYTILVLLISFSFDFQYLTYFFRLLLNILTVLSSFCIFIYFQKKYNYSFSFAKLFLDSVCFYIIGTIFFVAIPPLKTFWSSILADLGKTDFSGFLEYVTRFGFAGFSGFGTAFMVCCGTITAIFLFMNYEISIKQMKNYSILLLLGSFFYGRIGLAVTFLSLGLLSLYLLIHKKSQLFCFYLKILFFIICLIILIYFLFEPTRIFIEWLFEPVFNFFEKGEFSSASTDGLSRFYKNFHPNDKTFFLGDGYWLDLNGNGYYGHTDVGFMRNIYYGGIFYTTVLYCVPFSFVLIFYLLLQRTNSKGAIFISFLMIFQLVLFEIKGDVAFFFIKFYLPIYFSVLYKGSFLRGKND